MFAPAPPTSTEVQEHEPLLIQPSFRIPGMYGSCHKDCSRDELCSCSCSLAVRCLQLYTCMALSPRSPHWPPNMAETASLLHPCSPPAAHCGSQCRRMCLSAFLLFRAPSHPRLAWTLWLATERLLSARIASGHAQPALNIRPWRPCRQLRRPPRAAGSR